MCAREGDECDEWPRRENIYATMPRWVKNYMRIDGIIISPKRRPTNKPQEIFINYQKRLQIPQTLVWIRIGRNVRPAERSQTFSCIRRRRRLESVEIGWNMSKYVVCKAIVFRFILHFYTLFNLKVLQSRGIRVWGFSGVSSQEIHDIIGNSIHLIQQYYTQLHTQSYKI